MTWPERNDVNPYACQIGRGSGVAALGAQAALAQLVVFRAGLERFGGNEFFVGIALSIWLVAGAIAAAAAGRQADRRWRPERLVVLGASLTAFGVVLSLFILRLASTALSPAGISLHPIAAAGWMALAAALPAAGSGVLFAWLVPALDGRFGHSLALASMLESCGSAIAGFVIGSLLIDWIGTSGLAVIAILCGAGALPAVRSRRPGVIIPALAATLVLATGAVVLARLPISSGGRATSVIENRFGRFGSVELDGQTTITDGTRTLVDCEDWQTPEVIATVVHGVAPDAANVLFIAGNAQNAAVLSTMPSRRVVLVQPDMELHRFTTRMCKTDAGAVDVIPTDPLVYLRHAASLDNPAWNAVVVDLGRPETLNRARLVGSDTFELMRKVVGPDGMVFVALDGASVRPSAPQTRLLAAILKSARPSFSVCSVLPIDRWWIVCGDAPIDVDTVIANARGMTVERRYATDRFLADALNPFNLDRLTASLTSQIDITPASDRLKPSIQLHALTDWAARFHPGLATGQPPFKPMAVIVLLALIPLVILATAPTRLLRDPRRWGFTVAAITGAVGIAAETSLMWMVEATWGALHLWLGGLVAAYMAGLGVGSWLARKRDGRTARDTACAGRIGTALTGLGTLAILAVVFAADRGLPAWIGIPLSLISMAGCATAAGATFQLAAATMWSKNPSGPGRLTGIIRGVDTGLAGLAAIATPLFLIPLAGTPAVLVCCAGACLALALHKSA